MKTKRISDRAAILLALILDHTKRDDAGSITCYWVPSAREQYSASLGGYVWVSGSGDASALKALESRGLIQKEKVAAYSASATEDGLLYFEREIHETGRVEDLRRIVAKNEAVMNGRGADE